MKKLFISQPMRDKTDEEIKAEREEAIKEVERRLGEKVQVIDSFFEGAPHNTKPLWFLGKSIELLAQADIVYFCRGWKDYRGCRIEEMCAQEYGIEHRVYKSNWRKESDKMTREEAKAILYKYTLLDETYPKEDIEAFEIAIKTLEQESCEDAISRQAVIQHICQSKDCYKENCKGNIYKRCPDTMWVYDLPSINPQEPCEDCISREWLKTAIHNFYNGLTEEDIQTYLDSAPSVKPKVEQEPKTHFVEKSNFDIKQYNTDLQSAYDCGKASQEPKADITNRLLDRLLDRLLECIMADISKLSPEFTAEDSIIENQIKGTILETLCDVLRIIEGYKACKCKVYIDDQGVLQINDEYKESEG